MDRRDACHVCIRRQDDSSNLRINQSRMDGWMDGWMDVSFTIRLNLYYQRLDM
jgi:hypothetical protein